MADISEIGALYAYDIRKTGPARSLDAAALDTDLPEDVSYRWVHLDLDHPATRGWIADHTDDFVAQALTWEDTRPRLNPHNGGFLLNLRGVNLNPNSDPEDMVSVRLWVTERLVISVRRRRLMAVVAMREAIEGDNPPATPGAFLTLLSSGLIERMDPVIRALDEQVDGLEETSLSEPHGIRAELADLRRTTVVLRRYIGPQREALAALAGRTDKQFSESERLTLRETLDRITRLLEDMDAIRERCGVLNDQLTDLRAEEMNRTMLFLSVISAIFLPLGFLTGLLGVNVGGIPGTDNAWAFTYFCGALIILTLALVLWFRHKRWL
ncbi:MAG: zinc transporter ZntB [Pseudomonadota bacterium]